MSEGAYYCPKCGGVAIAIKALFMPGIMRVKCFDCGMDVYTRAIYLTTWRKRND